MLSTHPELSSNVSDTTSLPVSLEFMRFVFSLESLICSLCTVCLLISFNNIRIGRRVLHIVDSAMHSASVVLSAISVWSLLDHVTGQLQYVMTKPVLDSTDSCNWACFWCNLPVKSLPTAAAFASASSPPDAAAAAPPATLSATVSLPSASFRQCVSGLFLFCRKFWQNMRCAEHGTQAASPPPVAAAAARALMLVVRTWTSDAPKPLLCFFPGDERWWDIILVKMPPVIDCNWVHLNWSRFSGGSCNPDILFCGDDQKIPILLRSVTSGCQTEILRGQILRSCPKTPAGPALRNPDTILVSCSPILLFHLGNNSVASSQNCFHPPSKSRFLLNTISNCIFGNFNWIGILEIFKFHPRARTVLPWY